MASTSIILLIILFLTKGRKSDGAYQNDCLIPSSETPIQISMLMDVSETNAAPVAAAAAVSSQRLLDQLIYIDDVLLQWKWAMLDNDVRVTIAAYGSQIISQPKILMHNVSLYDAQFADEVDEFWAMPAVQRMLAQRRNRRGGQKSEIVNNASPKRLGVALKNVLSKASAPNATHIAYILLDGHGVHNLPALHHAAYRSLASVDDQLLIICVMISDDEIAKVFVAKIATWLCDQVVQVDEALPEMPCVG